MLEKKQVDDFLSHLSRHMGESGKGENIIFAPFEPNQTWNFLKKKGTFVEKLATPLYHPGWERVWIIYQEQKIVAHLILRSDLLESSLHRAKMEIGVEYPYRKKGFGRHLVQSAILWAENQSFLAWIDLRVFSHNQAARNLYLRLGFVEVAQVKDAFRIKGTKIDDIQMVLEL